MSDREAWERRWPEAASELRNIARSEPTPEAASPPLDGLLAEIEKGAATADHGSIEDGPAFARGARWAAERMAALRDEGETT